MRMRGKGALGGSHGPAGNRRALLPPPSYPGVPDSLMTVWFGRVAGAVFVAAPVLVVPSTLLVEPVPPLASYAVVASAALCGAACLVAPWERIPRRWLHLIGIAATLQVGLAVAVFGIGYSVMCFLIAALVAYALPGRLEMLLHLMLISLVIAAPVAYDSESSLANAQFAALVIPCVCLVAFAFAYLRSLLERRSAEYHRFAEETLALSARISGQAPVSQQETVTMETAARSGRRRWLATALVSGAIIPFTFVSLAAAGIELPAPLRDTFDSFGVGLPNQAAQPEDARTPSAPTAAQSATGDMSDARSRPRAASAPDPGPLESSGPHEGRPPASSPVQNATDQSSDPSAGGGQGPAPFEAPLPPPPPPDVPGEKRIGKLLNQALGGLGELLAPRQQPEPVAPSPEG